MPFPLILLNSQLGAFDFFWTIVTDVTNLETTKTCGLTQPPLVVTIEVWPDTILKKMFIFLTIMITIPCILIPVIRVVIVVKNMDISLRIVLGHTSEETTKDG